MTGNSIVSEEDAEMRASDEFMAQCWEEMSLFALELYQQRLVDPGDDLVSLMAHARIDGEPMSVERYLAAFGLLIVGGNETTRNSISGFPELPVDQAVVSLFAESRATPPRGTAGGNGGWQPEGR